MLAQQPSSILNRGAKFDEQPINAHAILGNERIREVRQHAIARIAI